MGIKATLVSINDYLLRINVYLKGSCLMHPIKGWTCNMIEI